MKSLKIMFLLFAALLLFGCGSGAETKEESFSELADKIYFDEFGADEGELLRILDSSGKVIAYYEQIENELYDKVKGVKIYDLDKVERYILMPRYEEPATNVYIERVDDSSEGGIYVVPVLVDGQFYYESSIELFDEPYELDYNFVSRPGGGFIEPVAYIDTVINYNGKAVFFEKENQMLATVGNKVDSNFISTNPLESAIFVFSFKLIRDVRASLPKTQYYYY